MCIPNLFDVASHPQLSLLSDTRSPAQGGYLGSGLDPKHVGSAFDAVRRLSEACPWWVLPDPETPILLDIPALGVHGARIAKNDIPGPETGLRLFANANEFEVWHRAQRPDLRYDEVPSCLEIFVGSACQLSAAQQQEIEQYGWAIQDDYSYPDWAVVGEQDRRRDLTAAELLVLDLALRALAQAFDGPRMTCWLRAWDGRESFALPSSQEAQGGRFEVVLTAQPVGSGQNPVERMRELSFAQNDMDTQWHDELIEELLYRFRFSPEGFGRGLELSMCQSVMEIAQDDFGCTIANLGPDELEDAVFVHFPNKRPELGAERSSAVLEVLCMLYQYLGRRFALPQASACIARLQRRQADKRLARAITHHARFGYGEGFLAEGDRRGFAVHTREGLHEWIEHARHAWIAKGAMRVIH